MDVSDPYFIDNWVEKLGLECANKSTLGLIGSSFFLGIFAGLFFVPDLADSLGRKPVWVANLIVSIVCQVGLYLSTNFSMSLVLLAIWGVMWNAKFIVGLSYAEEFLPNSLKKDYVAFTHMSGTLITIVVPLMYLLISPSWRPSNLIGILQTLASLAICPFLVPESPKYLLTQGKFGEARKSLQKIASVNGMGSEVMSEISKVKFV